MPSRPQQRQAAAAPSRETGRHSARRWLPAALKPASYALAFWMICHSSHSGAGEIGCRPGPRSPACRCRSGREPDLASQRSATSESWSNVYANADGFRHVRVPESRIVGAKRRGTGWRAPGSGCGTGARTPGTRPAGPASAHRRARFPVEDRQPVDAGSSVIDHLDESPCGGGPAGQPTGVPPSIYLCPAAAWSYPPRKGKAAPISGAALCLGGWCRYRGGNCEFGTGLARFAVGDLLMKPMTAQLMSTPADPYRGGRHPPG